MYMLDVWDAYLRLRKIKTFVIRQIIVIIFDFQVWTQLDPTLTTGLKTRLTPENPQDQWYNKFVRMIEEELNKPIHLQGNFYKPNTIAVKLNSIMKMLKFVIAKKIFYGLVVDEINQFREVITTLTNGSCNKFVSDEQKLCLVSSSLINFQSIEASGEIKYK